MTIEKYISSEQPAVTTPGPYAFLRIIAMPPADGYSLQTLMYEYALNATTRAAAMKATGKRPPASSATWPVRAKMPAPIMTPVPIAIEPVSVRLPFS